MFFTFSVPVEPTSSLVYTTIQPSMASTTAVIKGTESILQPTPIQAGLSPVHSNSNLNPRTTGIITGSVIAAILVVVIIGTVIVAIAANFVRRKPKKQVDHDSYMIDNLAYETSLPNPTTRYSEYHTYEYPRPYLQLLGPDEDKTTDAQKAKVTTSTTEGRPCTTYIMNMAAQRNEAYGASLNDSLDKLEYSYVKYY